MRPTAASLRQWLLRLLLKRLLLLLLPILQWPAKAHDADGFVGAPHRGPGPLPKREVLPLSQTSPERLKSPEPTQENSGKLTLFKKPHQTAAFDTFGPCVRTHSDATHLFIESTGLPSHPMMIGITAWQQQVPLPQSYTGANAWFQRSSGHLRVNVRAGGAVVEYVRAYLPSDEGASRVNGSVSHRCEVLAR